MTMGAILADVALIGTTALTMGGEVVSFITSNELVLCFALFSFVGLGIGVVRRLIG